jgi:hypothetical protein
MMFRTLLLFVLLVACQTLPLQAAGIEWEEVAVSKPFKAPLSEGEKPRGISGMACFGTVADDASRQCFAINDEEKIGQVARLDSAGLTPEEHVVTLISDNDTGKYVVGKQRVAPCPKGKSNKQYGEFDGEGVAYSDNIIFVVSSHSCNGNDKYKASSYLLARFPTKINQQMDNSTVTVERTWRLADALVFSKAKDAFGKAKTVGTNIEGIAVADSKLYAGLRTPTNEDVAMIVAAPVEALFAAGNDELPAGITDTIEVRLAKNTGIRDLAALGDGKLLILSGPTLAQNDVPYELRLLDLNDVKPDTVTQTIQLLALPTIMVGDEVAKAETVTVVSNGKSELDVIVLYDNIDDGRPRRYHLPPVK